MLAKAAAGTADADFDPSAAHANADGPDLDERDDEGCTPLHVALLRGECSEGRDLAFRDFAQSIGGRQSGKKSAG